MSGHRQPLTLERVKARCTICGDCWEWKGACNGVGHPKVAWMNEDGRTHKSARRVVWTIVRGELPDTKLVTVSCGNIRCLNPAHLKLTSKAEVARRTNAKPSTQFKRRVKAAAAKQATEGKITMEIAREIRASEKTGKDWARDLNCSVSLISKVRQNKSWVDYSSPFAGLGARS
jgi:hypothetical protein